MLKTIDGRDLVFNDGTRIKVPDGTIVKTGKDGVITLTAFADAGNRSVSCVLTVGATEEYVRFVLNHQETELKGVAPRN